MARVGVVSVDFEANVSKFLSNINQANKALGTIASAAGKVGTLIKTMVAYFSVHEIVQFIEHTEETAESLEKLSIKLRTSAKDIQGFAYAAKQSGMDAKQFMLAWEDIVRQAGAAASGISERGKKAFEALGIDVKKFAALGSDQQLLVFLDRLNAIDDEAVKLAAATRLVGGGGNDLIAFAAQGSAAILDLKNKFDALHVSLTDDQAKAVKEMGDTWKTAKDMLQGIGMQIVAGLAKPLEEFGKWLITSFPQYVKQFLNWVADMADSAATFVQVWKGRFDWFMGVLNLFLKALATWADQVKDTLIKAFTFELPAPLKKILDTMQTEVDDFMARQKELGLNYVSGDPFAMSSYVGTPLPGRPNPQATQKAPLEDVVSALTGGAADLMSQSIDVWNAGLTELNKIISATPDSLRGLADGIRGAADAIHPFNAAVTDTSEKLKEVQDNAAKTAIAIDETGGEAMQALLNGASVKKPVDSFAKYFQQSMVGALENFGDRTIDTLLNINKAGKNAFKDLASSILKDLAAVLLKAAALRTLMAVFNSQGTGWTAAVGKFLFDKPGAAFGTDFTVGGTGGPDSKAVAFRATPGERIMAIPPGSALDPADTSGVQVHQTNYFASGVDESTMTRALAMQRAQILAEVNQRRVRKIA